MTADRLESLKASSPLLLEEEAGWLIEEEGPHWIALPEEPWPTFELERKTVLGGRSERREFRDPIRRTKDASDALRFARKSDAEAFIRMFARWLLNPIITAHLWPTPDSASIEREVIELREAWEKRAGTVVETGPGASATELARLKIWFNSADDAHAFDQAIRNLLPSRPDCGGGDG